MRKYAAALTCLLVLSLSLAVVAGEARQNRSMLIRTKLSKGLTYGELVGMDIDVLAVHPDGTADLAVTEDQYRWLGSKGALVVVLERVEEAAPTPYDKDFGEYHTYEETIAELDGLAQLYPAITSLDTLGTSIEGRYIIALKISDNPGVDEDEPEVFIMGCNHAREIMTVEVSIYLGRYLLENYVSDPDVAALVDGREIWIAPMINPDGHVYVEENNRTPWYTWWRKNRRDNGDGTYGVDLNRNYGYMWGYDNIGSSPNTGNELYRGTAPFSEPETQAVRDFCASRDISVAVSFHSYGELILYPWGYTYDRCDDNDLFAALGDTLNSGLGYVPQPGAELYLTNGGSDDWLYGDIAGKNRIYGFTVEMNTYDEGGFGPDEALIIPTCEKLMDLNLTLIRIADDPRRIMAPAAPVMHEVALLEGQDYLLSWSGGTPGDPNTAVAWDVMEYGNVTAVFDSCEGEEHPWSFEGFTVSTDRAAAGLQSYYSGSGNSLVSALVMEAVYPLSLGDTISCSLWYDIEEYFDWAYLEASPDHGTTWTTVPGDRTIDLSLVSNDSGYGITGSSEGWVDAEFYLGTLGLGEDDAVLLRFLYFTDTSEIGEGIYIDQISGAAVSEGCAMLVSLHPDTFLVVEPSEIGEFYYVARGIDAEGQRGPWSNIVGHEVSVLTPAETPALMTGMEQNYPNPFNPVTTISFTVGADQAAGSAQARVLLELYDVSGSRVAVLEDGYRPAGRYSMVWDGTNGRGRRLASGIYFARLLVGTQAHSRKLVLLR